MSDDEGDHNETASWDVEDVECPACGKHCCLIDYQIDGCLREGNTFTCEHCDATVLITAVDWEPTIYCIVAPKEGS